MQDTQEYTTSGTSTTEQVKDSAREMMEQTGSTVSQLADRAREQVKSQVSTQKERAVGSLDSVTGVLHDTGHDLQEKGQATVGNLLDGVASQVDSLTEYLRGRNVDELLTDVQDMARRNPAVFVGGAFVLGLVAARFLKSSSPAGGSDYRQSSRASDTSMGSSNTAYDRASVGATGYPSGSAYTEVGVSGAASTMGTARTSATADTAGTPDIVGTAETYSATDGASTGTSYTGVDSADTLGAADTVESVGVYSEAASGLDTAASQAWSDRDESLGTPNVTDADLEEEADMDENVGTRRSDTF